MEMVEYLGYAVLSAIDFIGIWFMRTVAMAIIAWLLYLSFRYVFIDPYCPKCRSRKKSQISFAGYSDGGFRCNRCHTPYWIVDGKPATAKPGLGMTSNNE